MRSCACGSDVIEETLQTANVRESTTPRSRPIIDFSSTAQRATLRASRHSGHCPTSVTRVRRILQMDSSFVGNCS